MIAILFRANLVSVKAPSRICKSFFWEPSIDHLINLVRRRHTRNTHAQVQVQVHSGIAEHLVTTTTSNIMCVTTPGESDKDTLSSSSIVPEDKLNEMSSAENTHHDEPENASERPSFMPTQTSETLSIQLPLTGELLPHSVFRAALSSRPIAKEARRIMREQLSRCQTPKDILRIIAVAMQRRETAADIPRIQQALRRALYRTRNQATDDEVLKIINVIFLRLKLADLPVPEELVKLGVKFAARSRSLPGMKRYLKEFKLSGWAMNRGFFRAIIAKFSIGSRGLGEIRNGRWRRKELLQVLLGFEDTPPEDAYHLEVFLHRSDWQFFHGWLAALSRCKAFDQIWKEWEWWLSSPTRRGSRRLNVPGGDMTTQTRGDYWFVEQMTHAGDLEKAWKILGISGISFSDVRPAIRARLLEEAEHATISNEEISQGLINKYASELGKIEQALGMQWVWCNHGTGYHVSTSDIEARLETLSSPDFVLDPDYGFPWEEPSARERDEERNIMEAEEEIDGIVKLDEEENIESMPLEAGR